MADDEPRGSLSGRGILIVEDDFLIAAELARLLRDRGYQVLGPIPSVAGACAVLQWQHPAAALLDLRLRDGCAVPAAKALAEVGVPFALVTGSGTADLGEPLLQKVPRLGKPYDETVLLRMLDGLLTPSESC